MTDTAIKTTTTSDTTTVKESDGPGEPFRPSLIRFWGFFGVLSGVFVAAYVYLLKYGLSTGLDSLSPTFRRHWYPVMAINIVVLWPLLAVMVLRLAHKRCSLCKRGAKVSGAASVNHELQHLWTYLTLTLAAPVALVFQFLVAGGVEPAWHQILLRDTTFSPTHIFLFQTFLPIGVALTVASFLYGRTRLPRVFPRQRGLPLATVVLSITSALVFVLATFNEFGHTQWWPEERFSQPAHALFIVFYFVFGGVVVAQIVPAVARVCELLDSEVDS